MRTIEMVPVDKIHVLNPRVRNRRIHQEIIENIRRVGLKRPITVSRREGGSDNTDYDLVCGQGRLEAFLQLGHPMIPAFVVNTNQEDCLVMSLVENIARRQHLGIELMREIGSLHARGYDDSQIADKLGVTSSWVNMVVGMLEKGEERLISAVESGLIPISLAVVISRSDDAGIQEALADAYTQGNLKGKKLVLLKHLLEQRAIHGKLERKPYPGKKQARKLTAVQLVKTLEKEVAKNALLAKKAEFTHGVLSFVVAALRELVSNPEFVAIVKAEGMDTLPKPLEERMAKRGLQ
jgi:ParB family chromosome partitioning protein